MGLQENRGITVTVNTVILDSCAVIFDHRSDLTSYPWLSADCI